MKDAVSEANLTVVAIILMLSTAWKTCCADAGGVVSGNTCRLPNQGTIVSTDVYSKEERRCVFHY